MPLPLLSLMKFAAKFGTDSLISTHNIRVTTATGEKCPSNAVKKGGAVWGLGGSLQPCYMLHPKNGCNI